MIEPISCSKFPDQGLGQENEYVILKLMLSICKKFLTTLPDSRLHSLSFARNSSKTSVFGGAFISAIHIITRSFDIFIQ